VRIDPGNTAFTPLDFVSHPYSHSLAAACGWGALFGFLFWAYSRYAAGAMVVSLGVISHWLSRRHNAPARPIFPGRAPRASAWAWWFDAYREARSLRSRLVKKVLRSIR
jgi:hypothetical protein